VLDHGKKIAEGTPRDLIAQHLEPDVVEVYGVGRFGAGSTAPCAATPRRVEVSGETVFFYTRDAAALLMALAKRTAAAHPAPASQPGGPVFETHRPPNSGGRMMASRPPHTCNPGSGAPARARAVRFPGRCSCATCWSGASWPFPAWWAISPSR